MGPYHFDIGSAPPPPGGYGEAILGHLAPNGNVIVKGGV